MKKLLLFIVAFSIVLSSCKKNDSTPPSNQDNILSDNAIIVSSDVINSSLVAVDSTKLTFTASGSGVDKVKVGSILISDISTVAPIGFLRKVTGISTVGSNKVYTTEQASLTDAIVKGKVTFNRSMTDSDIIGEDSSGVDISAQQRLQALSFIFTYNKVLYDADGNSSTTYDQIKIDGEMKIEPMFDFELDIVGSRVNKFVAKMTLKNTNKISAESRVVLASFNREIVLKTFQLKPFTILIAGVPVPIAKQWIAIVLGVDGSLTARVTAGAQNINTAVAGVSYENSSWSTINTQNNSFTLQPLTFEGAARVEPWLQARYEIRPYGIKESRIYIGVRGSVIGEASVIPTGLNTSLKWGVKFSAKAQMQIWDRAVLNYEQIFFEREFLISQSNTTAFPNLTTTNASNISQTTAQSGGTISSDGGATVTLRGVCWSTSPNPTTSNNVSSNGTGVGTFTSSLTGLTANTTYYVRAYATNSSGTGYGNEISFTTQPTSVTIPTVVTTTVSGVTQTSAQSGGTVNSDGGASVTARGVCWSTSPNPTTANNVTSNGTGIGSFTSSLSGLVANTTYYVRAYATNSSGTGYGNQITFSTASGTVTDIDGNVYTTVTIGTQVWLVENLKVTRYRNGDAIPNITDATQWANLSTGAYCNYNNDINNANIYGRLYNWQAVTDVRNIAPVGWHVPTEADWAILTTFIGGPWASYKLKETGTSHWTGPNTCATNQYQFTALPGGIRFVTGTFNNIFDFGTWWSTTINQTGIDAYSRVINYSCTFGFGGSTHGISAGLSVRCVKD